MSVHIPDEQLQDYADGALTGEELSRIEQHLSACEDCRAEADALRNLVSELAALRTAIEPRRDLRPDIWRTIDSTVEDTQGQIVNLRPRLGQRTLRSARGWLAAAAVLLVLVSSTMTWILTRQGQGTDSGAIPVVTADYREIEARYVLATNELEHFLDEQRAALSPVTRRILEENLRVIDRALAEAKQALEMDPANADLSRMLFATYEKKLGLLRTATQSQTGI